MMLASKFRGCLVGALVGDCLGAPFESDSHVSATVICDYIKSIKIGQAKKIYKYTDDTAMTSCIAESLISCKKLNCQDLAKRFQEEYFREPGRGYGSNIPNIFVDFKEGTYDDIYESAKQQFNGNGSYGNGAAMRISPVPLFCYDLDDVLKVTSEISRLTHAHQHAITGAILLSVAIKDLLDKDASTHDLNEEEFLNNLLEIISSIDSPISDTKLSTGTDEKQIFCESLKIIKELLRSDEVNISDIVDKLGNSVSAQRSVPTAIYVFLRTLKPVTNIEEENPFIRTVSLGLQLGGDTDTITSMASSLCGAYHGSSVIPPNLQKCCEGVERAIEQAEKLFEIHQNRIIKK